MRKTVKPKDVKTEKDLLSMPRDNWDIGDFSIGFDNPMELYLFEQKFGEAAKQKFLIPLAIFSRLCREMGFK